KTGHQGAKQLRKDVAEDLHHELYVKYMEKDGFVSANDRRKYLFSAATNLANDWWRKQRKERSIVQLRDELADNAEAPLNCLIRDEDLTHLNDAIHRLPPLYRQVLVLHYLQGQKYKDIAQQLGKTEHQVRALRCKAIKQSIKLLRSNGQE